jgi:hypothetical protein
VPNNSRVTTSNRFQGSWLLLVGFLAFMLPSLYLWFEWYDIKRNIEWIELSNEEIEKFNRIQNQFQNKTFLHSTPCTQNAGKVLHKIIPWSVPEHKEESFFMWKDLLDTSYVPSLSSFQVRVNSLQAETSLSQDSLATLKFPNENPTWFEEISSDYDCWNLDQDSPRTGIFPFAIQEPLPRYDIIYNWGLFYILEGIQNKRDVRLLGKTLEGWTKILMSTEHLDASFLALQFLIWQNEILSKDPSIPKSDYLSEEELRQLTFVIYNAPRFYGLWTDTDKISRIPQKGIATCAGLREGLRFGWLYQQPLRDKYTENITHMEETLSNCRLELPQALWNMSSLLYLHKTEFFCATFPNNIHCTIAKIRGVTPHYVLPVFSEYLLEKQEAFWMFSN